ncbi:hypothetical protein [Paraclostridium bifermentans]|uniref:hypothetical protein n=1 Tax=Paraclostridium bifermentans TaxID=1490 RepID=UPI0018AA4B76|nr:hypothetical protein [Paraclostridium bifermentans]
MNNENNDLTFSNHKNYCETDGNDLSNLEIDSIKLNYEKVCNECGKVYNNLSLYCEECGNELILTSESEKKLTIYNLLDGDLNKKEKFKMWINDLEIKRRILAPLFSICVLFVISIWIKLFINFAGLEVNKFLNISSIILALNLVPLKIVSSSVIGLGNIGISMSLISILIIPFITILVSSLFFIKKESLKGKNIIKEAFILSCIYGVILGTISILGKQFINLSMGEYYTMSIGVRYSFLRSILNGVIIAFLPIYIVLYGKTKDKKVEFNIFNRALKTVVFTYVSILVLIILGMFFNKIFLSGSGLSGIITYPQLALYILHFINLIPVGLGNSIISIFNIGDINLYLNNSMILLIYAIMLLNIVILVVSGYDIKNKVNDKKYIKYFSAVYSMLIAASILLSGIDTSGSLSLLEGQNYDMYSYIESSSIIGLIISFVYSYILISIGYKLNKE